VQGAALNAVAHEDCKVLVVGNPCNTNAMIAMENAPRLKRKNFHALTRLDENRWVGSPAARSRPALPRPAGSSAPASPGSPHPACARCDWHLTPSPPPPPPPTHRAKCQLALKSGKFYTSVARTAIWGNHSTTQVGAGSKAGRQAGASRAGAGERPPGRLACVSSSPAPWQPGRHGGGRAG